MGASHLAQAASDAATAERTTPRSIWRPVRTVAVLLLAVGGSAAIVGIEEWGAGRFTKERIQRKSIFSEDLNLSPDEKTMYTLSHIGGRQAADTIATIVAKDDKRFIPVLIEMLDANGTPPIVIGAGAHRHIFALRELVDDPKLAAQQRDSLSYQWHEWYATSSVAPPEGFTAWKGKLMGRIDQHFVEFLNGKFPAKIRVADIRYAGAKINTVPPLDHPAMISADEAAYLESGEPVCGIKVGGDVRAYPLRILDSHEIVNDVVGGVPLTLTYCPLSSAAIAYRRTFADGKTYSFGRSGLVYHNNNLLFDHETKSLWNQLTGTPVVGALAASDKSLTQIPLVITKWEHWRTSHPATTVLAFDTGFDRSYEAGMRHGVYFSSNEVQFPDDPVDERLAAKTRVFGLRVDRDTTAFETSRVAADRVVNHAVGDKPIVLISPGGTIVVSGVTRDTRGRPLEDFQYDAGGAIRAYERGEESFKPGSDDATVVDADADVWKVTEEALVGPDGRTLNRIDGVQTFWFAWSQFYPDTALR